MLKDYHNSLQSHIYAALQNSADFVMREGVKTL